MKNKLRIALALILFALFGLASACDEPGSCRQCGFSPNSQQQSSYINGGGEIVIVVFWTDASGCVVIPDCQGQP